MPSPRPLCHPGFRRFAIAALPVLMLAACGGEASEEAARRPVLVTHPVAMTTGSDTFVGDVRAREESPLSFRVGGTLVERKVDVGDRVSEGELLAVMDGDDYGARARAAQAQLAAAEAELSRARADQARMSKLADEQLVSRSAIDAQDAAAVAAQGQANAARAELQVARNQVEYTELRAPVAGVIAGREAEAGQVVAAGQPVFTLAADGPREVAFAIPEGQVESLRPGMAVEVSLWSLPGKRWPGRIREIAPAADPASRTYAARAAVDADTAEVELGQSARVHVDANGTGALGVPLAALVEVDGEQAVYVVDPSTSKLRLQPVRTAAFGAEQVPVLEGVGPGDWVVAAGAHLLRDGQAVSPVDRDNRPVAANGAPAPEAE